MKSVYIELTDEQKKKLQPLTNALRRANKKGELAVFLAQIHVTNEGDAVAVCRVLDEPVAKRVQIAISPKYAGQTVGQEYAKKQLAKARKQ